MGKLAGKVAVITGASKGMGRHFVAALVKAGRITYEAGLEHCSNRNDYDTLVSSSVSGSAQGW